MRVAVRRVAVGIASFKGSNRDFRAWLREQRAGMTRSLVGELVAAVESGKVVALAEYRAKIAKKKAAKRAAMRKFTNPSIA